MPYKKHLEELPTHKQCMEAVEQGEATPLQEFIYYQEPAGEQDVDFREQLLAVINGV